MFPIRVLGSSLSFISPSQRQSNFVITLPLSITPTLHWHRSQTPFELAWKSAHFKGCQGSIEQDFCNLPSSIFTNKTLEDSKLPKLTLRQKKVSRNPCQFQLNTILKHQSQRTHLAFVSLAGLWAKVSLHADVCIYAWRIFRIGMSSCIMHALLFFRVYMFRH